MSISIYYVTISYANRYHRLSTHTFRYFDIFSVSLSGCFPAAGFELSPNGLLAKLGIDLVQSWRSWDVARSWKNTAAVPFLEHDKFLEKFKKAIWFLHSSMNSAEIRCSHKLYQVSASDSLGRNSTTLQSDKLSILAAPVSQNLWLSGKVWPQYHGPSCGYLNE